MSSAHTQIATGIELTSFRHKRLRAVSVLIDNFEVFLGTKVCQERFADGFSWRGVIAYHQDGSCSFRFLFSV